MFDNSTVVDVYFKYVEERDEIPVPSTTGGYRGSGERVQIYEDCEETSTG
jgi:hypothetical protein